MVERNMSLKNPVTPPGIDPGTVRLVAQRINHYAIPGPRNDSNKSNYTGGVISLCFIERTYTHTHTQSNTNSECQAAEGAMWQLSAFR
jgi:hypothetical protein